MGDAGDKKMQVRLVARGCETVLADAASEAELFLTDDFLTRQVGTLQDTFVRPPSQTSFPPEDTHLISLSLPKRHRSRKRTQIPEQLRLFFMSPVHTDVTKAKAKAFALVVQSCAEHPDQGGCFPPAAPLVPGTPPPAAG